VLTSPSGTAVTLMSSECADGDPDVDAIFDDLSGGNELFVNESCNIWNSKASRPALPQWRK
jgi:hypothetical protein